MKVFLHNRHDKESRKMLETLESGILVIDYFEEQEKVRELGITVSKLPCIIDVPDEPPPKPKPLEERIAELEQAVALLTDKGV